MCSCRAQTLDDNTGLSTADGNKWKQVYSNYSRPHCAATTDWVSDVPYSWVQSNGVQKFISSRRKPYFRVHILSSFGHACSGAQPLAWPVTVSVAGGKSDEGNLEIKSK